MNSRNDERGANYIALIFAVLILLYLGISIYGCTPSRSAASLIEPTISRLEAEVANPALPDSLRPAKLDSLRRLKQSAEIAQMIIGSGKKVKKNSYNFAINGDATAIQGSKVKDQSKVKEKPVTKPKNKPVSKPKNKPVSKTGSGSSWYLWPLIIGLALIILYLVFRRFLPGFLKIPFLSKG